MEFYGMHFSYAGQSSRDVAGGFYIGAIDEPRLTAISGSAEVVSIFNRRTQSRYYVDKNWDDSPLEFSMEIIADEEIPLTVSNRRAAEKWLFHRDGFKKLYIDMDDDCDAEMYETIDGEVIRTYLNCIFVNPEKIESDNGIIGFKVDVICDAPNAWQDPITKTFTPTSGQPFTLTIDSDLYEYVYPKVSISMGSGGGDLQIVNHSDSDSRITSFSNLIMSATFVMDGKTNYITGGNYVLFQNRNFVRLLDGDNRITVTGDVESITFEWQNRRYL